MAQRWILGLSITAALSACSSADAPRSGSSEADIQDADLDIRYANNDRIHGVAVLSDGSFLVAHWAGESAIHEHFSSAGVSLGVVPDRHDVLGAPAADGARVFPDSTGFVVAHARDTEGAADIGLARYGNDLAPDPTWLGGGALLPSVAPTPGEVFLRFAGAPILLAQGTTLHVVRVAGFDADLHDEALVRASTVDIRDVDLATGAAIRALTVRLPRDPKDRARWVDAVASVASGGFTMLWGRTRQECSAAPGGGCPLVTRADLFVSHVDAGGAITTTDTVDASPPLSSWPKWSDVRIAPDGGIRALEVLPYAAKVTTIRVASTGAASITSSAIPDWAKNSPGDSCTVRATFLGDDIVVGANDKSSSQARVATLSGTRNKVFDFGQGTGNCFFDVFAPAADVYAAGWNIANDRWSMSLRRLRAD